MIRSIIILFVVLCSSSVSAQTVSQWTAWGDAAFAQGEYYGASRFYAGALNLEPGRMALQWKQAEACRSSNQYDKAHELYNTVYRKDQGRTYPEALLWLGEMLLCDGQYDDAKEAFGKLTRKEKDKTSFTSIRAKNALLGIELAHTLDPSAVATPIEHLQEPINSYDTEFGAATGPDGLLYFATLRGKLNSDNEVIDTTNYNTTIVSIAADAAKGTDPVTVSRSLGTTAQFANTTWTPDGKTMLFTRCDTSGCAIWKTSFLNGTFSETQQVSGLPTNATNTQPMLTVLDGIETLFFASDATGGAGGFDIWKASYSNGTVTNAQPIGAPINTPGNERTPWYDPIERIVYFSSDFLPGMGGYDIFHSELSAAGSGEPINAGLPWNSNANDLYPALYRSEGISYITSNRKGSFAAKGETCCNDIYRIRVNKIQPVTPLVAVVPVDTVLPTTTPNTATAVNVDPPKDVAVTLPTTPTPRTDTQENHIGTLADLKEQLPLTLYFHNDEPDPRTTARTTRLSYHQTYSAYKNLSAEYTQQNDDPTAINAFFKEKVDHGFQQLKALTSVLLPALQNGERITLKVRGHASPLAINDYNIHLSERRINSLYNHFKVHANGAFRTYLDSSATNGGVLRIEALPFGEEQSASGVNDDRTNLKLSVYSVDAALERRIEVELIEVEDQGTINFSIGTVRQGVEQRFKVPIRNSGTVPLQLTAARSACDCIQTGNLPETIAPGATENLELIYTGRTRPGPLTRTIIITTDGDPAQLELIIDGTVTE